MPWAACITAVLLNCPAMPAPKADRLPRRPRAAPVQVAAPPDVEPRLNEPAPAPETAAAAYGLSPDETVAIGFQETAIYSPPEPEPERQPTDPSPSSEKPGLAVGLSPDEMVAIGFQEITIYSPLEAEPEKFSERERRRQEKAERRRKQQDKPVETRS